MYNDSVRDINDLEREELLDTLDGWSRPLIPWSNTLKWTGIWAVALLACSAVPLAYYLLRESASGTFGMVLLIGTAFACVGILTCILLLINTLESHLRWNRAQRRTRRKWEPVVRATLETGRVLVKRVTASAVVTIEECEDEGNGYIYDVGEGRILFLKGQQYSPVADTMAWPNTEFDIVRSEDGSIWFGIFCYGRALIPEKVISATDVRDDIVWSEHEDILDGNLHDFVESQILAADQ